jgi:glycine cleavage system H protein
MKELSELDLPEDFRFTQNHEWTKSDNAEVVIGVSDYAQDQLGDIVFVELPQPGDTFNTGDEFGTVESVKAVSELFMPIGGEVTAVNEKIADDPGLVNSAPNTDGWLVRVKPSDPAELDNLMTTDEYLRKIAN